MLPKPFLTFWAAKLTAELAVDSLPFVQQMAERDRQGAVDYLKGASRRYTKVRAEIGSMAHDAFERLARGEAVGHVHPDIQAHVRHFREFLAAVNPELVRAEDVAWSDEHEYAGSFDAILRIWVDDEHQVTPDRSGRPMLIMADWKTSKDVHAEVALQMAAYANADRIVSPDGTSTPMPHFDGAAVLHVTEDQWSFYPVRIDADVFEFFLSLRHVFNWDREANKTVIGRKLAASTAKLVTGTQRRAR
ncbi:hypothetical protein [Kitasatospora sp. MAP5-34]|nr:hypothetical protein [Kitasatospora sp. MAP5-34]